jgi:DNA integrity scanning protein DisA with diadenylate cyclase activity
MADHPLSPMLKMLGVDTATVTALGKQAQDFLRDTSAAMQRIESKLATLEKEIHTLQQASQNQLTALAEIHNEVTRLRDNSEKPLAENASS